MPIPIPSDPLWGTTDQPPHALPEPPANGIVAVITVVNMYIITIVIIVIIAIVIIVIVIHSCHILPFQPIL